MKRRIASKERMANLRPSPRMRGEGGEDLKVRAG